MFVIKNPDKYQTNASVHSKDTRQKSTLLTFSKITFNSKWSLLILSKNI